MIGNKEKIVLENRDRDQCWKTKTRSVLENKVEISSKRKETLPILFTHHTLTFVVILHQFNGSANKINLK